MQANAQLKHAPGCGNGCAVSPCISGVDCWIPFLLPPPIVNNPLSGITFGSSCHTECPCLRPEDCSLLFLIEDEVHTECPDLHRTCTRSSCCPVEEKIPTPISSPPTSAPARSVTKSREATGEGVAPLTVTLSDKSLSPNSHRILEDGAKVWTINGKPGATVHLKRGYIYKFDIKQDTTDSNAPGFFITRDVMGPGKEYGARDAVPLEGTSIIRTGLFTMKVDENTPDQLYYQSTAGAFRGGLIRIQ